jgi:hypothetical protein
MTNDVPGTGTETGTASPGPAGSPPETAAQQRPRRWWPITIVAVVAALVAGVLAQRTIDHHRAVITTYRVQVESTLARLGSEADRQFARPASQRSLSEIGDLADSIGQDSGLIDPGLNGSERSELEPLNVEFGSGSIVPGQIAFEVTITSPYAESTIALWDIRVRGTSNQGVCVLTSSLAGNGRVTEDVQLGGHIFLQPCLSSWWAPGPVDGSQPRLSLANIHEPPR